MKKIFSLFLFVGFCLCCGYSYCMDFEHPIPGDSRVKIFIYTPDAFIPIKFCQKFKSMVKFQADEQLQLISIGDPMSWKFENIDNNMLFISPLDVGVKTNMIIITNKRTYLLDISSAESDEEEDVAYVVKFYYPELSPDTPFKKNTKKQKVGAPSNTNSDIIENDNIATDLNIKNRTPSSVNFKYSYTGKDSDILPIKIFDNGIKTYFQFKINNNNIPDIYVVKNGKEYKVKTNIEGSYLVVNTVTEQFSIRENTKLICIFNKTFDKSEDISSNK